MAAAAWLGAKLRCLAGRSCSGVRRRSRGVTMKPILVLTLAAIPLAAQPTPVPRMEGKVARGTDGKPDVSGIWQALGVSLFGETGELRPGEVTSRTIWGPPVG